MPSSVTPLIWLLRDPHRRDRRRGCPYDGADVIVRLTNGASALRSVRACIGSRGRSMTNAELYSKIRRGSESALSKSGIDAYLASKKEDPGRCAHAGRAVCSRHDAAPDVRGAGEAQLHCRCASLAHQKPGTVPQTLD